MPIAISSTFVFVDSQRLAISLIKVILVAKKALDAYFINSELLLLTVKNFAPLFIIGKYNFSKIGFVFFKLFDPITILSGYLKSLIASPSLKNSGLEIISNLFFLFFLRIIFSTSSPVPIGTVDLFTMIL